jgi:hypothetical protein
MTTSNATLTAQILALTKRVDALAAKVKADETKLNPLLTASNLTFLAGLGKLGFLGTRATDPYSGSTFQDGERGDYIVPAQQQQNALLTEMVNQNWMFSS